MRVLRPSITGALALTIVSCAASAQREHSSSVLVPGAALSEHDRTDIWLSSRSLRYGQGVTVNFRTAEDAFVTIVRISTDGRFEVLFPSRPHHNTLVRAGRTEVARDRHAGYSFRAHEPAGTGFVFAITSGEPFDFRDFAYATGSEFRLRRIAGGDPFFAVEEFAESVVHPRSWYSLEYAPYVVERHSYHTNWPSVIVYDRYTVWQPYRRVRCYDYDPYRGTYYDCQYYYYSGREISIRRPRFEAKSDAATSRPEDAIGRRRTIVAGDSRPGGSPESMGRRPADVGDHRPGSRPEDGEGGPRRTRDERGPTTAPGRRRGFEDDGPGNSNDAPGRRRGHEEDGPGNSNNAPGRLREMPSQRPPSQDEVQSQGPPAARGAPAAPRRDAESGEGARSDSRPTPRAEPRRAPEEPRRAAAPASKPAQPSAARPAARESSGRRPEAEERRSTPARRP